MKKSEEYCFDNQYAVSIKEDTVYMCLHFTRNHEEQRPIRRIQKDLHMPYFEDIDYFKDFENQFPAIVYNDALTPEREISSDFENEFPAIVYNDALTSEPEVSSEPTDLAGKKSTTLVEYL
ncbi:hypothetical protein Tco_0837925 [Tanacetum coccineum]